MCKTIKTLVLVMISFCAMLVFSSCEDYTGEDVPTDYISVFHGGSGELTHETYIYKIENGKADEGFRYVNTESWGMTAEEWKQKVTGKGEVTRTDDVFSVAEKNDAYSFVTLPGSTKTYTIDEYKKMFIMN